MDFEEKVFEIIGRQLGYKRVGTGFESEIYADYRDEISDSDIAAICESKYPMDTFCEKLDEAYIDAEYYYRDELAKAVINELEKEGLAFDEDEIDNIIEQNVSYIYPEEHFLNQEVNVDIMLDTGDGNYDYCLNSEMYPCYYGREADAYHDKASLVWLAKQQGYTKGQIREYNRSEQQGDKGFLATAKEELLNLPSQMSAVTFLVKMSLKDAIELNELVALKTRNGKFYDATKNPYCGYIILGKETMTGLYDCWSGGGSLMDIELEKDVRIPVKYIRCALPDAAIKPYSVGEVYGMCGSAWKSTLKEIHKPKNL